MTTGGDQYTTLMEKENDSSPVASDNQYIDNNNQDAEDKRNEIKRKKVVLWICCLATLMISINNYVMVVASPSIKDQLHFANIAELQWITTGINSSLAMCVILQCRRHP